MAVPAGCRVVFGVERGSVGRFEGAALVLVEAVEMCRTGFAGGK